MMRTLALLLALACTPAWAINKCVDPKGNVSYSDKPCPSGQARSTVETRETWTTPGGPDEPAPGTGAPASEASGWLAAQEKQRQKKQIEQDIKRLQDEAAALRKGGTAEATRRALNNERPIELLKQKLAAM